MSKQLSSIDWDAFDESHPVFQRLASQLVTHANDNSERHKLWHVPKWIGREDLVVLFGKSGEGKSVFAIDIACNLAAGRSWDGQQLDYCRNVLYVAAERKSQVDRRVDAFCQHHGSDRLESLTVYGGAVDLCAESELRALARSTVLKTHDDLDLIVIDTLSTAMSGSDSNPDSMARAVGSIKEAMRFCNDPDAQQPTVIVVHHSPVSGEARLRGGGQLLGAADVTIHVGRKGSVSTARVMKCNDSDARPSLSYGMASVSLGTSPEGIETMAPVLVPVQTKQDKPAAVRLLSKGHREALEALRQAIDANGGPVSEAQWRKASDDAAGDISPDGKAKRFKRGMAILDEGLAAQSGLLFSIPAQDKTGQNRTNV